MAIDKSKRIDSLAGVRNWDRLSLPDLLMLAQYYYDTDSVQKSLAYVAYIQAYPKASEYTEVSIKAGILEGFALLKSGNPHEAFSVMFGAFQQSKALKRDTLVLRSAAGLGIISRELGDFDKALTYFHEALDRAADLSMEIEGLKVKNEIGSVYLLNDNPENALEVYMDVRRMGLLLNDSQILSVANGNIASVNLNLKNYPEALQSLEENLRYFRQHLGLRNSIVTLLNAGEICTRTGNFQKAGDFLHEALELSQINNFPSLEMESHRRKAFLFERMNDYSSALLAFRTYTQLKDSIFNIEKQRQIVEIENKYRLEQDSILLAIYRQKMRARNITILLMVLILVFMFVVYFFHRRNSSLGMRLAEGKKQQMLQEIDAKNRELASLALSLGQKGQLLQNLEEFLRELQVLSRNNKVRGLIQEQRSNFLINKYLDYKWEDFTRHFEQVHPHFFDQIRARHPELSSNDLIHCAFIILMLKQKDIALILGINERSVQMIRYRLKKRLNLSPDQDLSTYITELAFAQQTSGNVS